MATLEYQIQTTTIPTRHATISVYHITNPSPPSNDAPSLLLIHGNSFCSKIFRHIQTSPRLLSLTSQIIAFDLPGHGSSSDAHHPAYAYGMRPYAETALEVCRHLKVKELVVLGWSLGGHVAIEMIPLALPRNSEVAIKGIFIIGTPALCPAANETHKAFKFGSGADSWRTAAAAIVDLTQEQREVFAHNCADPPYEDWMQACVDRTDGRARKIMLEGAASGTSASDQRAIVEEGVGGALVGVLNGKEEPFISTEYVRGLKYKNLWKGETLEWEGCLHAPFWARPKEFEDLFAEFLIDSRRR